MGKVNVKFFGAAIEAAKRQSETEVDASNVRELLDRLSDNFGDSFRKKVLDSQGRPQSFVNVFVNDKDIRHLNDLETPLNDGDEVLILPAVAGG
ncbi:MAG: MoaD family protein [Candidatus Bathyarchaeia archaeon]|jgi:MoaD family protein